MLIQDCYYLGIIAKLHGFKGEVSLFLDVTNPKEYKDLSSLYLEIDGGLTPFFIEGFKLKNKGFAAIKFEGIDSELAAKRLLKKKAYLPLRVLPQLDQSSFYDHEVIDYQVVDNLKGSIGNVINIIDLSSNPLLQIEFNGKEVLIPIFNGLIEKVDRKNKVLYILAPEGLIDLYLN